jgi:hypothetical protein
LIKINSICGEKSGKKLEISFPFIGHLSQKKSSFFNQQLQSLVRMRSLDAMIKEKWAQ